MKITSKISLAVLVAATAMIWIAAPLFYREASDSLMRAIGNQLVIAARSRADQIERFLDDRKSEVRLMAALDTVRDAAAAADELAQTGKIFDELHKELNNFLMELSGFHELFVMNSRGIILASTDKRRPGLDRSEDSYFTGARERTHIKDAYFSPTTGKPTVVISTPIREMETGSFLGVFAARIDMAVLYRITALRAGLGRTGGDLPGQPVRLHDHSFPVY